MDISKPLQNITAPTLALAGDSDPIAPSKQPKIIAERVPTGQKILSKRAEHLPMLERQDKYKHVITGRETSIITFKPNPPSDAESKMRTQDF